MTTTTTRGSDRQLGSSSVIMPSLKKILTLALRLLVSLRSKTSEARARRRATRSARTVRAPSLSRSACESIEPADVPTGIAAFSNVALVDFRTSTAAASASHSLMPTDDASTSTEPAAAAVDQHRAILPPFTARAFDGSTVTIRRRARRSQAQVLASHKQQRVHSAQLVRRNGGGKAQVAATQAQAQGGDGGESLATTPFHRLLESIKSEWEAARVAKEEESLRYVSTLCLVLSSSTG